MFANSTGWLAGGLICEWLRMNFSHNTEPMLLLLDEFSGHWTEQVRAMCTQLKITLLPVPAGCTSVSQPADVAWNKPFKGHIRRWWVDSIVRDIAAGRPLKSPEWAAIVETIIDAWDKVSCIEGGFRAARLVLTQHADTEINLSELSCAFEHFSVVEQSTLA